MVFILVMIFEGVWEIAQPVYMCYVDWGILWGMLVVVLGIRTVFYLVHLPGPCKTIVRA